MVTVSVVNECYAKVDGPVDVLKKVKRKFSYYKEGFQNTTRYKEGLWDGKVYLFKPSKLLPMGLIPDLLKLLKKWGVEYSIDDGISKRFKSPIYDEEEVDKFIESLNFPFELYEHQRNSIHLSIKHHRLIVKAATNAGKSLIAYVLCAWFRRIFKTGKRILIIVPTTQLVTQFQNDFVGYSTNNHINPSELIGDINSNAFAIVANFHKLMRIDESFYTQFSGVILDEAHTGTNNTIQTAMYNMHRAWFRLAMSGSIKGTQEMPLKAVSGPLFNAVKAKTMIDSGSSAKVKINAIKLVHSKSSLKKKIYDYSDKVKHLIHSKERNRFIAEEAMKLPGNTIIFVVHPEHGEKIAEHFSDELKVYVLNGNSSLHERNEVTETIDNPECKEKKILIVTYGIFRQGISVKRLDSGILAFPSKSENLIIQTLGRMMRMYEGKNEVPLIDIVDILSPIHKREKIFSRENFLLSFEERESVYKRECHPVTIKTCFL